MLYRQNNSLLQRATLLALGICLALAVGMVQAKEAVLRGYIARDGSRITTEELVNQYGDVAKSPAVAAAIRGVLSRQNPNQNAKAKLAADCFEAMQKGIWKPGADPMMAIMCGYVPPNMPPEQAAILARALPRLPRIHRALPSIPDPTPMVADPTPAMPYIPGVSRSKSTRAANQELLEQELRDRFGPISMPGVYRRSTDHDGSIREMTDENGNVVVEYAYDPFGNQTRIAGSGPDADFGFAGMFFHRRANLYLTPARPYSPALGRFISRDPIEEAGGINLYSYAGNDPINFTDRSGFSKDMPLDNSFGGVYPGAGSGTQGYNYGLLQGGNSPANYIPRAQTGAPLLRNNYPVEMSVPTRGGTMRVPSDYVPRMSDRGGGTVWQRPGQAAGDNRDTFRIMPSNCGPGKNPKYPYPDGYAVKTNSYGQPVDIRTGKPSDMSNTHFPLFPGWWK